jgi:hypothetical protein
MRTVLEQTSPPLSMEASIVAEEAAVFPGWEDFARDERWLETVAKRERDEWDAADLIVCGSPFVRDTLQAQAPLPRCASGSLRRRRGRRRAGP